jgi:hypothetical protein
LRHLPKVDGHSESSAFGPTSGTYTFEGGIERLGQLVRGINSAPDKQWRSVGRMLRWFCAIGAVLVVIAFLAQRIAG